VLRESADRVCWALQKALVRQRLRIYEFTPKFVGRNVRLKLARNESEPVSRFDRFVFKVVPS
jgi:hypothetical protein